MIIQTKCTPLWLLACLLYLNTNAQHCGYCGAEVFVAEVVSASDSSRISGLHVSFLDSLNEPIMIDRYNGKAWEKELLVLYENPKKTRHRGNSYTDNPIESDRMRFEFANDNYLAMHFFQEGMKLHIVDNDGEANGGKYESQTIAITADFFYPLCSRYSSWSYNNSFVKNYKPFQVRMQRMKN